MLEHTYAKAFTNALARGGAASTLIEGLVAQLKASGRMKLLPRIKRILEEDHIREQKNTAVLEVASKEEESSALEEAMHEGIEAKVQVQINDSLIRGWRVRTKGMLIDRSAKHSLVELYRHITN